LSKNQEVDINSEVGSVHGLLKGNMRVFSQTDLESNQVIQHTASLTTDGDLTRQKYSSIQPTEISMGNY
jgi:hypothetical protein